MDLDLDDLAVPATLRSVDSSGEPGADLHVNQAFRRFYESSEPAGEWRGLRGDGEHRSDVDLDRLVAAGGEPIEVEVSRPGCVHGLTKSPVRRGDRVVAVLSVLSDATSAHDERWRSRWLERLVDVAAMPTVVAAAKLAFAVADDALGLDRGALLRFDGQMVDVFATTAGIDIDRRLHISHALLDRTAAPGVVEVRLGDDVDDRLLGLLGVGDAVAISLHVDDAPWGLLVLGAGGSRDPLTELTRSMLDSLGATLATLIERDRARQRLQESNRRLEEYAHAAAHDLRSPLRRIRSFAQILQARLGVDELDRAQLSDFAERIARGAARLDALLESMLEHANISALAEESTEYTDLQELAESICQGIVELSHEPKPTFHVVDLPEVRLPRDAAERVLRNLIDNALKYGAPDRPTVVDLRGEPFDGGVRVRVHDNGVGIEPQFADKVFQLFNQLSNDTSGSGVGLAVVERLLSTRGARIWVESGTGSGATFVIEFPAAVLRAGEAVI